MDEKSTEVDLTAGIVRNHKGIHMTVDERDRYVIRSLVRVASFATILAGSVFLSTCWNGTVPQMPLVLGESVVAGGMLWFSYEIWKRYPGYAYLLPSLFLFLHVWMFVRAEPRRLPLVVQESSFAIFMYFLLLWLLTPRLRKQDFLPRIGQASEPQLAQISLDEPNKRLLWWLVTLAPVLVVLASGGLVYTAQQGVIRPLDSALMEIFFGAGAFGLSYWSWRRGTNAALIPFVIVGAWLSGVVPLPEQPSDALQQLQRFSLKFFVFGLLLWSLKPHLRRKGLIP